MGRSSLGRLCCFIAVVRPRSALSSTDSFRAEAILLRLQCHARRTVVELHVAALDAKMPIGLMLGHANTFAEKPR
jgi:hypothetical protein